MLHSLPLGRLNESKCQLQTQGVCTVGEKPPNYAIWSFYKNCCTATPLEREKEHIFLT